MASDETFPNTDLSKDVSLEKLPVCIVDWLLLICTPFLWKQTRDNVCFLNYFLVLYIL